MSVKASDEMMEIIRRKRQKKDIRFYFAEHELTLMKYLDKYPFHHFQGISKLQGSINMPPVNYFTGTRPMCLHLTQQERGFVFEVYKPISALPSPVQTPAKGFLLWFIINP